MIPEWFTVEICLFSRGRGFTVNPSSLPSPLVPKVENRNQYHRREVFQEFCWEVVLEHNVNIIIPWKQSDGVTHRGLILVSFTQSFGYHLLGMHLLKLRLPATPKFGYTKWFYCTVY